jgi:hypothetical protein
MKKTKPPVKHAEWRRIPRPWQRVTRYDPELSRLMRETGARGYTADRLSVVLQYVRWQYANGDPEYHASPTFHTILRRVLKGEYDYLFN